MNFYFLYFDEKKICGVNFVLCMLLNWMYMVINLIWCLFFMLISRLVKKKFFLNYRFNFIFGCKCYGLSDDVKKSWGWMGNYDWIWIFECDVYSDVIRC